jgi:hypothetical protein
VTSLPRAPSNKSTTLKSTRSEIVVAITRIFLNKLSRNYLASMQLFRALYEFFGSCFEPKEIFYNTPYMKLDNDADDLDDEDDSERLKRSNY